MIQPLKYLYCAATLSLLPSVAVAVAPGIQYTCRNAGTSLTFDDGPYQWNRPLVDLLSQYGAVGTFFVNGNNWGCIYDEANVANLRHAYERGMIIASHSWNHYRLPTGSIDQLSATVDYVETALWKILGIKPALFRAPFGEITEEQVGFLNSRGYTVVGWSKDTRDSLGAPVAESAAVMNGAQPSDILLAHEVVETTPTQTIPLTLPGLVERGISFVGADECLAVPAYQAVGPYGARDATWTCEGLPVPGER